MNKQEMLEMIGRKLEIAESLYKESHSPFTEGYILACYQIKDLIKGDKNGSEDDLRKTSRNQG
jgi:hypothetical protein